MDASFEGYSNNNGYSSNSRSHGSGSRSKLAFLPPHTSTVLFGSPSIVGVNGGGDDRPVSENGMMMGNSIPTPPPLADDLRGMNDRASFGSAATAPANLGEFSFVGMQHAWSKALFPNTAAVARPLSSRSKSFGQAGSKAPDLERSSPVLELFEREREGDFLNQAIRIEKLEQDSKRLINALLKLRVLVGRAREEAKASNRKLTTLQRYTVSLESENALLRTQLEQLTQQFASTMYTNGMYPYTLSYASMSHMSDAHSETTSANGSFRLNPEPTYNYGAYRTMQQRNEHDQGDDGGDIDDNIIDDDDHLEDGDDMIDDAEADADDDDDEDNEEHVTQYEDLEPKPVLRI